MSISSETPVMDSEFSIGDYENDETFQFEPEECVCGNCGVVFLEPECSEDDWALKNYCEKCFAMFTKYDQLLENFEKDLVKEFGFCIPRNVRIRLGDIELFFKMVKGYEEDD